MTDVRPTTVRNTGSGAPFLENGHLIDSEFGVVGNDAGHSTEADAGVSTHHAHIETTFAFRTRILDYLWAGLPMVVTEGDHFAELVTREGLGVAVPADDVPALVAALDRILFDAEFTAAARVNAERVRESYTWDTVLEPLPEGPVKKALTKFAEAIVERSA